MSGRYEPCICDKDWCECEEYVLLDDYDDRTEVPCKFCAVGNHTEDGLR